MWFFNKGSIVLKKWGSLSSTFHCIGIDEFHSCPHFLQVKSRPQNLLTHLLFLCLHYYIGDRLWNAVSVQGLYWRLGTKSGMRNTSCCLWPMTGTASTEDEHSGGVWRNPEILQEGRRLMNGILKYASSSGRLGWLHIQEIKTASTKVQPLTGHDVFGRLKACQNCQSLENTAPWLGVAIWGRCNEKNVLEIEFA